jgi:hypothetical protein
MSKIKRNPAYKAIHANKDKRYVIITGGRGCFTADQEIETLEGRKKISEVDIGDAVYSYDVENKLYMTDKVVNKFEYDNKKLVKVKLKDGSEIKCTPDHKFFFRGEWLQIQEILTIFDEWKNNGNESQTTDSTSVQQKEE